MQHWPHYFIIFTSIAFTFIDTAQLSLIPFGQINHQWWRLFTGHLAHTNTAHAGLNIAGLAIICIAFWHETRWRESCIILSCIMLGSSLCISFLTTMSYVGLSSVLHGYLMYLLLRYWHSQPWLHGLFLCCIISKVIGEQFNVIDSSSTVYLIEAPIAIDGHLYGTLIGFFLGLLSLKLTHKTYI